MPTEAKERRNSRSELSCWIAGSVSPRMDESIQRVAERLEISRSEVLRRALRRYLAEVDEEG